MIPNIRILAVVVFVLVAGMKPLAAETYEVYDVKVETGVIMKTRDGVPLSADIYRPRAEGRFPVILERTSYGKHAGISLGVRAAARGFVYIAQDIRGRWASGGDWYPFRYESQDGYDSVEWAAALPYSNGKVGLWGGSYVGATQMLTAIAAPPHLAGIMPVVTASNYHSHWAYQGGAFMQLLAQAWSSALSIDTLQRRLGASAAPAYWGFMKSPSLYPLIDPGTTAGLADYYFDWIAHPTYDDYWKQWSIEEQFNRITVPGLHLAAWYDLFQDGSIRNYVGIRERGGSEAARKGQRLIIMPGGHAGSTPKIGEVDFGKDSTVDTWALGLRWYDYLLKGIDNGMGGEKPVRLFVMGKNVWRDEDEWPLSRAKTTRYYLHSKGHANTLNGDGVLSTMQPGREPSDSYIFDPADPTPTHGGPILGDTKNYPPGPLDQSRIEARSDVLVYTTPAFRQETEVTGPITLELYVSSSALDTDFTARLIDVWPDGKAINLTDGVLRARYRNSMERPEMMKPGEIYRLTINLWSTANIFAVGHKLRLEIASGSFPRFDRNPNTGENPEKATVFVRATNVIHHDERHASALLLPIVP